MHCRLSTRGLSRATAMAIEVVFPQLGESVVEGTITKWLVKEGDFVSKDQPLLEVATDKADSEIPSPAQGTVTKILAQPGDTVPVKSVLAIIEAGEARPAAAAAPASTAAPAAPTSTAAPAPAPSAQLRPPPAAAPLPAGTIPGSSYGSSSPDPLAASSSAAGAKSAFGGPLASPETRKIARDLGVDPMQVVGSGDRGRLTRDDVLRAVPQPSGPGGTQPSAQATRPNGNAGELQALINAAIADGKAVHVPPIPNVGYGAFKVPPYNEKPGDKVIPFTRRRRITAAHMVYSKQVSPQVVTVAEVDMQNTSRLRDAHKDRYKKEGVGLTFLSFIVHATAIALKENPTLNARVLDDAYVLLRDINLGVAVDTKEGLVVPVIKRADGLNVRGVALAIDEVATKARDNKLTPDDLSGASFSVTNPGLKGNLFGGAIISQPNVGILRIGELKKRVVVVESGGTDTIAIHPVMYMALSYDHRIVDGVAANTFLWRVRELLEKGEFEV